MSDDAHASTADIRALIADYCRSVDGRDWSLFQSLWHEDAIWDPGAPIGAITGQPEILAAAQKIMPASWRESRHVSELQALIFDGPDQAQAQTAFQCEGINPQNLKQVVTGSYIDRFERRDSTWKILNRQVRLASEN